ncbi:ATP synthase F1, epsilon subunit [Myxococcus xanthus DK 1622]|uniref:ATP synthase epsilon chain n=2 Tax=Myxococcus xanthus TaxID=34 RepID=ATPE_MYXXD|nr:MULTISPECIES: F0F1 ATP synthase subunit epsilon [Myxococcus]Q1CX38.1 RecName: Full=ATP synthase epsilon chain; AltName: Full=ATP synthase F1 sector epsilon subunit; AltName: Full=F-ATPase epsilon subunit [Myxococcus xanthus DK 1622]ABF92227.1 ATP synthase F1, epsilon subunit [Myxococcus xanthus DK 1622]NOJ51220.1 F0F1 ATP synthase subunit epsilon [Myxococcus xanthus]QDE71726.1 ATP synthase F1 subunit epsilon [Myxococcus xanthus]QDE79007.1 ATP synthase F1 subunit epsilon [Myxococcus xanthus]
MAKLTVEIVTPEKRILSVQADEAIVPGGRGLFGVRPGHTPFLSLMEPGALTLIESGRRESYFVAGGFVEVGNDKVLVLADAAEPVTGIDVEGARRRMAEAQERMKGMSSEDARFELEQATVRREAARIGAANTARA